MLCLHITEWQTNILVSIIFWYHLLLDVRMLNKEKVMLLFIHAMCYAKLSLVLFFFSSFKPDLYQAQTQILLNLLWGRKQLSAKTEHR